MLFTTVSQVVATTLKDYSGVLTDNITTNQIILWKLGQMGGIETRPGSLSIVESLISEENASFQWYSRYDPLSMVNNEGIDQAEYAWKQGGGVMQLSGFEKFQNSGAATQVINLWDAKGEQLGLTMRKNVSRSLFSDGSANGGKEIGGLLVAVENGDAWSTYGEIDSNTKTWWRNQFVDAADYHTLTNLQNGIRTLINRCTGGNDRPHLLVTTQTLHEAWEAGLTLNEEYHRMAGDEDMARAGWVNFLVKGIPLVWDEDMLPNTTGDDAQGLVALNLNYMKFVLGEGYDFQFSNPVEPDNQDSESVKCLVFCQLILSNRRRQGRMDIATS